MTTTFLWRCRIAARSVCLACALAACESSTDVPAPIPYVATLAGSAVRPAAITTQGQGSVSAAIHPGKLTLAYTVTWSDLSGAPVAGHVHGPATETAVGDVLVDFAALPTGSTGTTTMTATGGATGTIDLAKPITPTVSGDSLRTLFDAGLAYVDVHTVANGGGEVRGQLIRQ